MKLRRWQEECVKLAVNHYEFSNHFLCLATPAAGKSTMAAEVSSRLFESGSIDYVLCFSPSISVADGLRRSFSHRLHRRFDGLIGSIGCSYTYQAMCYLPDEFWEILSHNRVLVIFDEIHHCAGITLESANSWGEEIILKVQDKASYTLALTGTPWRSDRAPIALSKYTEKDNTIRCDYTYGLREAVEEGVCRQPKIVLIDNDRVDLNNNENKVKSFEGFQQLFHESDTHYRELISNDKAINYILSQACYKLESIRSNNPRAGGLVVTSSVAHAQKVTSILQRKLNKTAVVATYQNPDAASIINTFRTSDVEWIVSVGMVSEGTDIPRLQVCCHLSNVKTELYFRQVLGRILRVTPDVYKEAWLYTFAEPTLVQFAERIGEELPYGDTIIHRSFSTIINNDDDALNEMCDGSIVNNGQDGFDLDISWVFNNSFKPFSSEELISDFEINLFGEFRERIISLF